MPAPPAQTSSKPPAWVKWGGLLLGALALLPFLPWGALLRPPIRTWTGPGLASLMRVAAFVMIGWGVGFSALFGYWAARGSWAWATRSSHPWLTRCEAWTPLRGRWLRIATAFGLWILIWSAEWLTLIALMWLPSVAPTGLSEAVLAAHPALVSIVGAAVIVALGCFGGHLARRSAERRAAWNETSPPV